MAAVKEKAALARAAHSNCANSARYSTVCSANRKRIPWFSQLLFDARVAAATNKNERLARHISRLLYSSSGGSMLGGQLYG